jgi:hypothetical protein
VTADDLEGPEEDEADVSDARAAREEMRRTGAAAVPWKEVKTELGLT